MGEWLKEIECWNGKVVDVMVAKVLSVSQTEFILKINIAVSYCDSINHRVK